MKKLCSILDASNCDHTVNVKPCVDNADVFIIAVIMCIYLFKYSYLPIQNLSSLRDAPINTFLPLPIDLFLYSICTVSLYLFNMFTDK